MVLTDSGGIQEETTVLGVLCVILRKNTERPVTITMGTNYLVGTETLPESWLQPGKSCLEGAKGQIPPYWDGLSGKRIVAGLSRIYCKE